MKSLYEVIELGTIKKYSKEEILKDIKKAGLGKSYKKLRAEPTQANIFDVSLESIKHFCPEYWPWIRGIYVEKGRIWLMDTYMPEDTILIIQGISKRDKTKEHEETHYLQKIILQSFLSSEDNDLINNSLKYLSRYRIKKAIINNKAEKIKGVFPKARKLINFDMSVDVARECADLLSGIVMREATPDWSIEAFARYHSQHGAKGWKKIILLAILRAIPLELCCEPHFHADKRWEKAIEGLNDKEQLLISAFPPKQPNQKYKQLKILEEYISF